MTTCPPHVFSLNQSAIVIAVAHLSGIESHAAVAPLDGVDHE